MQCAICSLRLPSVLPEINGNVEAGEVLVVCAKGIDVDIELCRRNLARKCDDLGDFVFARLHWALDSDVVLLRLFANVELPRQELDQSDLDCDVSKGSVLEMRKGQELSASRSAMGDFHPANSTQRTSMAPLTIPFAVTVKFLPGTGGSGLTAIASTVTRSSGEPQELHTHPPPPGGSFG